MKYTILIYLVVAILASALAGFNSDVYTWFLILEFFVGATQIIGSIIRFIIFLKYKSQNVKVILWYWLIVGVYLVLAKMAATYYEYHVIEFDMTINYNIVILSLAWPIAFWYLFNISFLKSKKV